MLPITIVTIHDVNSLHFIKYKNLVPNFAL